MHTLTLTRTLDLTLTLTLTLTSTLTPPSCRVRCRPSRGSCASGTTASPRRSTTRSSRANRRKAGRRPPWRASAHGTRRRLQTTASPTLSDGTTGRCLATDRRSTTLTRAHTGSRTPTLTLTPSPTLALALALTLTRHIWAQGVLRAEHPQGGLRPDATTLILPARAPPVEIASRLRRDCALQIAAGSRPRPSMHVIAAQSLHVVSAPER